ncbi:transporter [Flavobacterium tegetincola]|uniref:transporter n=1 Tax=Flavobacterium tegetincola TaxID=150172 RepID=UPI0004137A85|nr:transporter [Flavobacterium tegetincola]
MIQYIKNSLLVLTVLAGNSILAQYTDAINSNRPGESQSAFSVGQTVLQAETGVYGISQEHVLLGTETKGVGGQLVLRYGAFFEQLEFNVDLKYQFDQYKTALGTENRNDFKRITLGAKYLIYDPYKNYEEKINILSWKANHRFKWRQFIPAVGVYAGANLNFNSVYYSSLENTFSPKLAVITQNQFSGGYVLVMNFIADKIATDFNSYGYILTMTKGFNDKWSGFLEHQGIISDAYTDYNLRAGAAYLIKDNIQIDASIGGNFKDTPSIFDAGIGLSWRFDKNYKPILIRSGKEGKDKEKDKKKEKKERKDKVETIEVEKP